MANISKINTNGIAENNKFWFALTVIYIIFDYGRPQVVFPFIGLIRPLLILILLLSFNLIKSNFLSKTKSRQINLIWLIIGLLIVYVPFARNNYYAYKTALSQLLYMPFILSLVCCVNSFERLKKIVFIFVSVMIYVSLYSIMHSGKGPGNYFADENDLSLYINTWLPFCYFLYFTEKTFKKRIVYGAGLVFGILGVIISFSRGGFVGLLAMAGIVWWYSKKKAITLALFFAAVIILFLSVDSTYWTEMSTVTDTSEDTASERIMSWKTGWDMFLDNPFGVGGNNFQVRFPEYQKNRFSRGMWGRVAHSLWFTLIPELGLIGIYLYISLLIKNVKDIFLMKNQEISENTSPEEIRYFNLLGASFLAALAGFFVSATFLSVLYYAHYWYLTGLIVAALKVMKKKLEENTPETPTK